MSKTLGLVSWVLWAGNFACHAVLAREISPSFISGYRCQKVFSSSSDFLLSPAKPEPRVIVLSAPSGGGKTTIAEELLKIYPNLRYSISTTSRAPRGQEVDGKEYHFVDRAEFQRRIRDGKFIEWTEYNGNFYGTEVSSVKSSLLQGQSVLVLPTIDGAQALLQALGSKVYRIFVMPPSFSVLEARLRGRGTDTEAAIQGRLSRAIEEMSYAPEFDHLLVNDQLQETIAKTRELIEFEGLVP